MQVKVPSSFSLPLTFKLRVGNSCGMREYVNMDGRSLSFTADAIENYCGESFDELGIRGAAGDECKNYWREAGSRPCAYPWVDQESPHGVKAGGGWARDEVFCGVN